MECLDVLNRFVGSLWNAAASDNTGILIVSDHGNAEDVSMTARPPVPTTAYLFIFINRAPFL
jgi:bisphosphoglycerate-independent phosphoglycerate mutase (AlkP superfamily)